MLSDNEKKLYALIEIEKLIKRSGSSLSLYESMPQIPENHTPMENVLILDELSYDLEAMQATHDRDILLMTDEQRKIYDEIVAAVVERRGGMFFLWMVLVALEKHFFGNSSQLQLDLREI